MAALRGWVEAKREERAGTSYDRPVRGAVIGGGLLGLEAAGPSRPSALRRPSSSSARTSWTRRSTWAAVRRSAASSTTWASRCA
ncbi:hypothetical protein NKG05_15185 [Oerskovia sp. M15]